TAYGGGYSGGGIVSNGSVMLRSSTITRNVGAGGSGGVAGNVAAGNTIISDNSSGTASDCTGTLTSLGYDLIENTTGCTIAGDTPTNIVGVPARLAPLSDNGGPTQTHAPFSTSPAIDAGDPAGCTADEDLTLTEDQRHEARSLDGDADGTARCDIGALETM